MARRTSIVRANPRPTRGHVPRLPHPSWRRAVAGDAPPTGGIASAQDFWERLGL